MVVLSTLVSDRKPSLSAITAPLLDQYSVCHDAFLRMHYLQVVNMSDKIANDLQRLKGIPRDFSSSEES